MTLWVYDVLVLAALTLVYVPAALLRRLARGVPVHVRERLGFISGPRTGRCVWIHAVSVGEAIAAAPLVESVRRRFPELPIVVTTVTETGAGVVRDRYAGLAAHRFFPVDLPGAARRAVDALEPALVILMETELWPNALRALAKRRVPVMVANGRISDRSYRRYRFARRFMRRMLEDVAVFAMQSPEDARRIIALGAAPGRVFVTGNLKNEAPPDPPGAADGWRRLLGLRAGQRSWIAGSTHRGEEAVVLAAHRAAVAECPDLALVLAPRHPERTEEVLGVVRGAGLAAVRRSELPREREPGAVVVLDSVGELAALYSVGDVVFVGGSLVPLGGHNLLEAAIRRKPVLSGPHTHNFREATALLEAAGAAVVVHGPEDLGRELRRLLADPALRTKMGDAGYAAVAARHGAVRETLDLATRLLRPEKGAPR
ncbi:MAG: 3-deoxy-D-manno-octulosonic acid transferase [Candidatus Rokubacteria bacterium]|nr:3-deoxy-D-manno-octulosonic acid transferase [Candidatus Rokubacteria bacterium]